MATSSFCYRILFLEDDIVVSELGRQILQAEGYEVIVAEDGFEGLDALKRSLPHIIISDLRMPNMNGFEFLSIVRRRFPTIPVIAISADFTGLTVPQSVLADAFFPKGHYKPAELFDKITDLIQELPTRPRLELANRLAADNLRTAITQQRVEFNRLFDLAESAESDIKLLNRQMRANLNEVTRLEA
jgi:CheY-like chemotaxis protein